MSTSDPNLLVLDDEVTRGGPSEFSVPTSLFAGAPDPIEVQRMANEFFHALPTSFDPPGAPSLADLPTSTLETAPPPVTAPSMQPEVQLPSDKHLPTLPASIGPAQVSPLSAPYQAPPAVPGVFGAAAGDAITGNPFFSFLDEARPLFNSSPAPAPSAADASVPTEPSNLNAPSAYGIDKAENAPPQVGPSSTIATPLAPAAEHSPVPPFSFLEELRPLFSYPTSAPGPVPVAPKKELTSDLPFDLGLIDEFGPAPELAHHSDRDPLSFFTTAGSLESAKQEISDESLPLDRDVSGDLDLKAYPFDAESVKRDFPILRERVNGRPLVWLDNAATTQKPQSVIDRLAYFYEHENSNVHRAAHELAARATDAYEAARDKVRRFVNASSTREIVFVRGATEGINLIAQSWGRRNIRKDDEIVITWLEHHANIVPWQMLCSETGAKLRVAPVDDNGQILLDEYEKLLGPKTRLVSMTQVSNALGVVTPAAEMIEIAHRYGAKVLLDGAQSVSHMRVDVLSLDCDFFVFSGHKVFGPIGIGVVYGKPEVLESMPPWQGGGNMIQDVTFEKTQFQDPPQRFEAGTGNIADAVGLGAAIDYLDRVGMPNVSRHEHELLVHATRDLLRVPGLRIIGTAKEKAGVLSFVLEGFKTEEVGTYMNKNGIAVRTGHHCAQPILRRFGQENTVRASLALYNTHEDIDKLVAAVWDLRLGRNSIA